MVIQNGKNTPINVQTGTVPYVGGAMLNWFQPMTFGVVTTTVVGFQSVQEVVDVSFIGVIEPLEGRKLLLKPEGQRSWTWYQVHSTPALRLNVDKIIRYLGVQYRVMAVKEYAIYGYMYYEMVQDWTGSGPTPVVT